MEIYELSQGERFLIETIRYFKFLRAKDYDCSGCDIYGRGYYVQFTNSKLQRKIDIILEEGLDIIFKQKTFFGTKITELSEIAKFKRPITSLKTLAELVQSDYMYLISKKCNQQQSHSPKEP